jgi:tetratricopeptide (TPR) repeat protein
MERILRVVYHAAGRAGGAPLEDPEEFLTGFSEDDYNRALADLIAGDPRAHAQELAYQAIFDADTDKEAVALARRALELDPVCVDALAVLAEIQCGEHVGEFIALLEEAVAAGRRSLGEPFFEEHAGALWEELGARPYLRARYRLADAMRISGRAEEAIAHFEGLLDLNPLDHQRARDPLLACYLGKSDLAGARALLYEFASDDSSVFHWGRVLERYLSGDPEGALSNLQRARLQNRHTEKFLTFRAAPPSEKSDEYAPGDANEAVHCLYIMGLAWAGHPEAVDWARSLRQAAKA